MTLMIALPLEMTNLTNTLVARKIDELAGIQQLDGPTKNSTEQDNSKSKEIPTIEPATPPTKFKKPVSLPSKFKIPGNSIPTPNLTPKAPEHPHVVIPDSPNDPLVVILDKHSLIPAADFSNRRDSAMTKLDSSKRIEDTSYGYGYVDGEYVELY